MTMGIAAICSADTDSPKIVFSADRQITAGIKFEHGMPKIRALTDYCYVIMSSSDTLKSDMIISKVVQRLDENPRINEIIEQFALVLDESKKADIERDVIKRYGLTYPEFLSKSRELSDTLVQSIIHEIEIYEYNFACEFLLFSLEPTPHIYVIDQDGKYKPHDYMGFAAIGNGAQLAFTEMTKYSYHPNIDHIQGLVRVYNTKRTAERISGVGETTDLYVLHIVEKDGKAQVEHWHVDDVVMDMLESSYKRISSQERKTIDRVMHKIRTYLYPNANNHPKKEEMKAAPADAKERISG